jgi:hypothetical protein
LQKLSDVNDLEGEICAILEIAINSRSRNGISIRTIELKQNRSPDVSFSNQGERPAGGEADQARSMSNEVKTTFYMYQGPLGQVVRRGGCFFASKDGLAVGTYNTFEEAMGSFPEACQTPSRS